jgi:hypothetical protein
MTDSRHEDWNDGPFPLNHWRADYSEPRGQVKTNSLPPNPIRFRAQRWKRTCGNEL